MGRCGEQVDFVRACTEEFGQGLKSVFVDF